MTDRGVITALLIAALFSAAGGWSNAARAATASLGPATSAGRQAGAAAPARPVFIDEGRPLLAPLAHALFCAGQPDECRTDGRDGVVLLDTQSEAALLGLNTMVNHTMARKADDAEAVLGDQWRVAVTEGDCEDFAMTKRSRLIALGWPVAALRIAVGRTRGGEGHAVLLVRTDRGDLVLDSLTDQISDWRRSGIILEKIQSAADPRRWAAPIARRP